MRDLHLTAPTSRPERTTRHRAKWRWRVPPALPREPGDPILDALPVLEENPGDAGVLLWQVVRDVLLWASTPPEQRAGLFAPGAGRRRCALVSETDLASDLDWTLRSLASVISNPAGADPEAVRVACIHVSHWAEERGAGGTALWFAQAAAVVDPASAQCAIDLGRLAWRLGRRLHAETWLRRTIGLARQSGDWRAYAAAFAHLGELLVARGDSKQAHEAYVRAARAARRHGLAREHRQARIGLMRLALQKGADAKAAALAKLIRFGWNLNDPEYPAFALDYAELKLRQEDAQSAASILKEILLRPLDPLQRLRASSLLAYAAASLRERTVLLAAWDETERLLREREDDHASAAALLNLAWAADRAGYRHKAAETAARAREIARRHNDAGTVDRGSPG